MPYALCWLMAHALCLMPKPYALCFMPNALCLMLYALCLNILHKIDYKKHILSCSTSTIIASATNKNLYILSACLVSYHRYRHTYGVWLMAYALCLIPYALCLNILQPFDKCNTLGASAQSRCRKFWVGVEKFKIGVEFLSWRRWAPMGSCR